MGPNNIKLWKCKDDMTVEYRERVKRKYEELDSEKGTVEGEWRQYNSVLARICLFFSKIGVIFFLKELFAKQGSYSSVRKMCRYVLKFRERCHLPSIYATCVGPIYPPNH